MGFLLAPLAELTSLLVVATNRAASAHPWLNHLLVHPCSSEPSPTQDGSTLHATARFARNFARTSDLALVFAVLAVRLKPVVDWVLGLRPLMDSNHRPTA